MAKVVIIKFPVWESFYRWMAKGGPTAEGDKLVTPEFFDNFRNSLQSQLVGTKIVDLPEEDEPTPAPTPEPTPAKKPRKPRSPKPEAPAE